MLTYDSKIYREPLVGKFASHLAGFHSVGFFCFIYINCKMDGNTDTSYVTYQ